MPGGKLSAERPGQALILAESGTAGQAPGDVRVAGDTSLEPRAGYVQGQRMPAQGLGDLFGVCGLGSGRRTPVRGQECDAFRGGQAIQLKDLGQPGVVTGAAGDGGHAHVRIGAEEEAEVFRSKTGRKVIDDP